MTPETIFKIASNTALLSWILLAILGRRKWVSTLLTAVIVPGAFAVVYTIILPLHFGEANGDFNKLSGIAELFRNPWLLLAGWIHYLAFDLFIGTWEVRDAAAHGISHWFVIPCLFLTFMFGPIGLLVYFLLRLSLRKQVSIA